MNYHLAIDIGASSGRHILGHLDNGRMVLEEVYRFDNAQVRVDGHDCWDVDALAASVVAGIKACAEKGRIPSTIAIDTWGVDFVLLDENLRICSNTVAYRDSRTDGMDAVVDAAVPFAELYSRTGIQKAMFNTIYQLAGLKREHPEHLEKAAHLLMMPDYLAFRLTGKLANEYTEASTTSLVGAKSKTWDLELLGKLGLPARIFGPLSPAGTTLGPLSPEIEKEVGFSATVILPASHDTGSAYLAVPARDENAIYLSSGTWSIIGVENPEAVTTPEACAANFSNEGGWNYRYRFLKNIMGLWMVQSIRRELNGVDYVAGKSGDAKAKALASIRDAARPDGGKWSYADLEAAARAVGKFDCVVDAADSRFFAPDSMIAAVREACEQVGGPVPETVGELMLCVYRSLAASYAREAKLLAMLTGRKYTSLNIVGGGSQDGFLNELTRDATGLEVFAGPTEGTAIGNLIVQMIATGEFKTLAEARKVVAESFSVKKV